MENKELNEVSVALASLQEAANQIARDAQEAAIEIESGEAANPDVPDSVLHSVERIHLLNTIMGNTAVQKRNPMLALQILTNQEKIFIEERNETFEALRYADYKEVLDGLADMFVVLAGYEFINGFISVEDIEAGLVSENFAGHVGSTVHSQAVGVLSNVVLAQMRESFNVARIAAQKLFLEELGVDPELYHQCSVEVLELVTINNLSKAVPSEEVASEMYANLTPQQIDVEGYHLRKTNVNGQDWYALFDKNGKFRKGNNYVGVDLQPIVDKLLADVPKDVLVDQEWAHKQFLRATKGVEFE